MSFPVSFLTIYGAVSNNIAISTFFSISDILACVATMHSNSNNNNKNNIIDIKFKYYGLN
jgi:hypothetical protein